MAIVVNNKQKLRVLQFSQDETYKLGWGIPDRVISKYINGIEVVGFEGNDNKGGKCLCCKCNQPIDSPIYYMVVLHDTFCEDCYNEYIEDAINYKEDRDYEKENYKDLLMTCKMLGIKVGRQKEK